MRQFKFFVLITTLLWMTACHTQIETGGLKIIAVDIDENTPVKLSDISGEIKKIRLELTDNSIIGMLQKVIYQDDLMIVWDSHSDTKVLVFDSQGKFIRRISSKGQGPGEFEYISDIAYDSNEKKIYIATTRKILCFAIDGTFLNDYSVMFSEYLFFHDDCLNFFSIEHGKKVENGFENQTMLYRMDKNFNLVDSLIVKSVTLPRLSGSIAPRNDFVSQIGKQTFVYYPVLTPEPIVRDTLYELKDNQLIPFLKLRFSNEGEVSSRNNRTKNLFRIWRSERFVFAQYDMRGGRYVFMHDLTTGRSANMKDGLVDDVHNTGIADIIPLHDNYFYYFCTAEISPETNNEEPNPDVYIGAFVE